MRCPTCGRDIDGPEFNVHFATCARGGTGSASGHGRSRTKYLTAKEAASKAGSYSRAMPLCFVQATRSAVFQIIPSGELRYLVEEWTLTYAKSADEWVSVTATADDAVASGPNDQASRGTQAIPPRMDQFPAIPPWNIDSSQACEIVEHYGAVLQTGQFGGGGLFHLRCADVDGRYVPLWWVPHRLHWHPVFVRGDTGQLAFIKEGSEFSFSETPPSDLAKELKSDTLGRSDTSGAAGPRFDMAALLSTRTPINSSKPKRAPFRETLIRFLAVAFVVLIAGLILRYTFQTERTTESSTDQTAPLSVPSASGPRDTWVVKRDGSGRISSIAVDPRRPSLVYAAASGPIGGLVRIANASDGTATAELRPIATEYSIVVAPGDLDASTDAGDLLTVAIDPSNSATIYSGFAGVFKSIDGGQSWTQVYNRPPVDAIAIDPTNDDTVYIGSLSGRGFERTADGGRTWVELPGAPRYVYAIVIDSARPSTLYAASFIGLYKSTDSGHTWRQIIAKHAVTGVAIVAGNADVLYAIAQSPPDRPGGVFKSIDGGASWKDISPPSGTKNYWALATAAHNESWVSVGDADGGGVWQTRDGGITWLSLNQGLTDKRIFSLAPDPTDSCILWAGTDGGTVLRIVQSSCR